MKKIRERLKAAIDGNGGYHEWALSWDVSLSSVDADEVLEVLAKEHYHNEFDLILQYPEVKEMIEAHMQTAEVNQDMQEQMQERLIDGDTFRMWSPDVAKKHGFAYKGEGSELPFEVDFAFEGRGGKHLVVTKFAGVKLTKDAFAEFFDDPHYVQYSNYWCRQLLGMIEEWDLCFTRVAVKSEEVYTLAWLMQMRLEREEEEGKAA